MAQLTHNPKSNPPKKRGRHNSDPAWLWVVLMGWSVAVHAALAIFTVPFADYLSNQQLEASSIPLEWVELPPVESLPSDRPSASNPPSNPPSKVAGTVPPASSSSSPENAPTPLNSGDIGFAPQSPLPPEPATPDRLDATTPLPPTPTTPTPTAPNSPEPSPPIPEQTVPPQPDPRQPDPEPAPEPLNPESLDPERPNANGNRSASDANPNSDSNSLPQLPNSPQTPASPAESDEFQTFAIDGPPPDVSETLPIPEDPIDPSTLAQTDINQQATPVRLVTQVTFDRLPTAASQGDNPEQLATPRDDVSNQVISDPVTSPCFQLLQPAVMTAIGSTVTLQVGTGSAGQITEVGIYESSQNTAYDALARCIVQNWEFSPATTQGEAVSSNATLVQLIINRN